MSTHTDLASSLLSVVIQSRQICETIVSNVLMFVDRATDKNTQDKHLLAQYCCSMILFLWKHKNYNLPSILAGLQKQSIASVHSFLCPDLQLTNPLLRAEEAISSDPYKEAITKLQQLSEQKPQVCRFCKKESVFTYVSAQTRSADEGMTTFVTCSLCGKRQRQ